MQHMSFFFCDYLMHIQQMSLGLPDAHSADIGSARFEPLIHIQPTSQKTPMDDVDNHVLLLKSHLVIAR